jgi:hypothetical protein
MAERRKAPYVMANLLLLRAAQETGVDDALFSLASK